MKTQCVCFGFVFVWSFFPIGMLSLHLEILPGTCSALPSCAGTGIGTGQGNQGSQKPHLKE